MKERMFYNGDIVRHFKRDFVEDKMSKKFLYMIVCTEAHHSETGERLVIYKSLDDLSKVCARPYEMFHGEVDKKKYPDAKQVNRFERIGESWSWNYDREVD